MKPLLFGEQDWFLAFELILGDFAVSSHINKVVYSSHTRLVFAPLVAVDFFSVRNLFLVHLPQAGHSPFFEIGGDFKFCEFGGDLFLKLGFFYGWLGAVCVHLALGAVVIGVVMHIAVFLILCFFLGSNHTAALAASYRSAIRNVVFLSSWLCTPAKQKLYPVVFVASNHWLMVALMPVAASHGKLKLSVIKRASENVINTISCNFFPVWPAEAPFIPRYPMDLRRRVSSGEH